MSDYLGAVFALLTTLSWSVGIFPFTAAARRLGANALNHFRLALAVLLLSAIVMIMNGISPVQLFTIPTGHNWLWLGLSGVVGLSLGDYFWFNALAIVGARQSSVFATLAPGGALLFGILLLHEHINLTGVAGIAVTVTGVVWLVQGSAAATHGHQKHNGSRVKGYVFAALSSVCQGCGIVLAKMGMQGTFPPVHGTWIRMVAGTVVLFLFTLASGHLRQYLKPVLTNQDNGLPPAILGTLFGPVIGVSLSLYAASALEASVAQTLFSLVPVVVLFLSRIIYGHRITPASLVASLVAIGGVLLLIWRDKI